MALSSVLMSCGNRVGVIEADGSRTTWTHDASYQLRNEDRTGAVSFRITHVYDPAGNRVVHVDNGACTTYTYDAANQLFTRDEVSGRTTYSYDASGNLAVQASPGGRTTNTWDGENRLTRVQVPGGVVNTMTYSADGLRTVKEDTSGTTKFIWDNQNVLLETDASNTVQAAYTLSPARYGRLLDQQRSGVWRYYHYDGIDSTSGLSDTSGQFLDNYVYEAYGSLRSSTGSTANPFRWVGGLGYYFDEDAAQYYIRARHYSPLLARWYSEDPFRDEETISLNLFKYVFNTPVAKVDPSGLHGKDCSKCKCFGKPIRVGNWQATSTGLVTEKDVAGTAPLMATKVYCVATGKERQWYKCSDGSLTFSDSQSVRIYERAVQGANFVIINRIVKGKWYEPWAWDVIYQVAPQSAATADQICRNSIPQ